METNTASGTVPQSHTTPNIEVSVPLTHKPVQQYTNPRNMQLERQGAETVPVSERYPEIRCGQCEWCGTVDPNYPAHLQYKLCPHYRGMDMACIYCPPEKDQVEVLRMSMLQVAGHPSKPGVLIAWCNSTECSKKHIERFKVSR